MTCPCGTGLPHPDCCGRFHLGLAVAPTAVALMRSRYSAFARSEASYLLRTWHPSTRPASIELEPSQEWTGLTVLSTTGGGLFDSEGTVEFRAHWVHRGQADSLHERSRFVREDGQWLYVTALPWGLTSCS